MLCSPEGLKAEMLGAGCGEVAVHAVDGAWGGPSVDQVMEDLDEILLFMPSTSRWTAMGALGYAARCAPSSRPSPNQAGPCVSR